MNGRISWSGVLVLCIFMSAGIASADDQCPQIEWNAYQQCIQANKGLVRRAYDQIETHSETQHALGVAEIGVAAYGVKRAWFPKSSFGITDRFKYLAGRVAQRGADAAGGAVDHAADLALARIDNRVGRALVKGARAGVEPVAKMVGALPGATMDLSLIPVMVGTAGVVGFVGGDGLARLIGCEGIPDRGLDAPAQRCSKSIFPTGNKKVAATSVTDATTKTLSETQASEASQTLAKPASGAVLQ